MVRAAHLLLALVCLGGCSSRQYVVVGSKNFTEQVVLAEIIAQQIEKRTGLQVEREIDLGGTLLAHEALKSGSIDLYPEYTGTALTAILKKPIGRNADTVLDEVRQGYAAWRLIWLAPLGFNNTFAMVVRTETAKRDHLSNLTDAGARPAPWRLGDGYEFEARPDGLRGLQQTYKLRLAGDPVTMDLGLLYPALDRGTIEMGAASETDAFLTDPEFTVLADDKHYFPPYQCAIVIRQEAMLKFPALRPALDQLAGRFSDETMRRLNAAVDRQHRNVSEVARNFLASLKLP